MLGEAAEHTAHELVATRIDLLQVGDLSEGVGEVAPATASDGDFGECLGATLEDMHLSMRVEPLYVNGAEAACGASTNDCDRH